MVKLISADEFLVSFLVDARGGYMQAQRMPQMKIFVPPDAAPAPTRIICHLLRPDNVTNLPGMNDCDGFASRILQIHSSCPRFQKPILIEMPHIALLKNGDRELVIMKKNFDSETWKEHSTTFNDETLKTEFGSLYESITPLDQLESSRICRIITTDVPNYFSLISRFQKDINMIGPDGGFIESKADKRIKLTFPQGALMKKIQISLEVQNVDPGIINHILGDNHNVSLSPIITVEPKRRKFRDLIEIQIGLPKGVTKNDLQHLRLLFSISEYTTKWEDVTVSTELVLVENCIAHATKISARVWLIYAPDIEDVSELANRIYALHCPTPYVGKFLAFARRHEQEECQIRCILITDDTAEKTLESQESFELITTGPEIEIINKLQYKIESAGNIVTVTKSDESILFPVQSFFENRITFPVRIRSADESFSGKIAFIPHFQSVSKQIIKPVTTLDIIVPERTVDMVGSFRNSEHKHRVKNASIERIKGSRAITKTDLNVKSIANEVGGDWYNLAEELGLEADEINLILNENYTDEEKAFMTLIEWQNTFNRKATGNELNRALKKIGREDVIKKCMGDISFVEDEEEVKAAMEQSNDEDKKNHDECWDDVISTKNKPSDYNESVDESMIVETGDDWSQSQRESKLSDDKSLVMDSTQDSESELHTEIKPVIDPSKVVMSTERTSSEKTAAFLLLVNQLDEVLPLPVIEEPSFNETNKTEVCEETVVKSFHANKQVENVDKSISLLNLINCQINNDFVNVDTVIDLDDFFPEPQEIDIETFSQVDLNEYGDNQDQNEWVLEVCIPEDKVDSLINNYVDCEITNTLINMKRDESRKSFDGNSQKDALKHRRYTMDKARLLRHSDMFHFHPPVSSLRRCFSVDSRHGRGIFSFCSQINNLQEVSILEKGDWLSEEDLKVGKIDKIHNEYPEMSIESELSKREIDLDTKINDNIKTEDKNSEIEIRDYLLNFVCDSPVTDLDDLSLSDDLEKLNYQKEVDEQYIEARPSMSAKPSHLDYDLDSDVNEHISPLKAGNVVYSEPLFLDSSRENEYDTEILNQSEKQSVLHEIVQTEVEEIVMNPDDIAVDTNTNAVDSDEFVNQPPKQLVLHEVIESYLPLKTEVEKKICPDNSVVNTNINTIESDEILNQSEKYSVLHEVIEREPQIQTEVKEKMEILPDGSVVNKKITRRKISRIITEKTTRDIHPDEEEYLHAALCLENPTEVIETKEELQDGSIIKGTITTSKNTTSTTSRIIMERKEAEDENVKDSSVTSMGPSETSTEND